MNTPITIESQLRPRSKRKGVLGFVAATAVTLLVVPAALAAVWSTNEVQSDFTLTDCLTKAEGQDGADFDTDPAKNYYINFDPATTTLDPVTGTAVLHETLSVKAPAGFRTFSTDTFHLVALACGFNYDVRLTALPTNSFGEDALDGAWADKGVKIYLSKVPAPGDDFTNAVDWDQTPLVVQSADLLNPDGFVLNDTTGIAALADNSQLVVGFELVGGSPALGTGDLNFQVSFYPVP